jgi:ATP-binding protein involved in chromosome partitioning
MKQYQQQNLELLGIVENMSTHVCDCCGHVNHVFGSQGAAVLSEEFGVPILAHLPLNPSVSQQGDSGQPLVLSDPTHSISQLYIKMAADIWRQLND